MDYNLSQSLGTKVYSVSSSGVSWYVNSNSNSHTLETVKIGELYYDRAGERNIWW